MTFICGVFLGAFISIAMVAMLSGDSYEDGYRQAVEDMEKSKDSYWW